MAEGGDELTNCTVCFEEYTEIGDHVPRLLPCSHTVCEKCLEVLIHNNTVDCPECRLKHEAATGIRSFTQNKYIITHLHKKQVSELEEEKKGDPKGRSVPMNKCQEHDGEETLFCREPDCLEPVCPICLARYHKQHKYVDIEVQKEKCEPLLNDMDILQKNLQEYVGKLVASKEKVEAQKVTCITALKSRKEEIIKEVNMKFDTLFEEAETLTRLSNEEIDNKISAFDRAVDTMNSLKHNMDPLIMTDDDHITFHRELIKRMITNTDSGNLGDVSPKYVMHNGGEVISEMLERLCGRVTFVTPNAVVESGEVNSTLTKNAPQKESPKITKASDFKFKETQSISTAWDDLNDLILTCDDSILVSGRKQGKWKILKYNVHHLRSAPSATLLGFEPGGIAEINLGSECLAVSNADEPSIEVRKIERPDELIHKFSVARRAPGTLYQSPSDVLLYADTSCKPNNIVFLDPYDTITPVQHHPVCFMIQTDFEGKDIVIISHGNPKATRGGIYAYNAKTKQLEWSVESRLPGKNKVLKAQGLATDQKGHIFVCDDNNKCIQMFHVTDGRYLGAAIRARECGLGEPWAIAYRSKMCSLVVAHLKGEGKKWWISIFEASMNLEVL